MNKKKTNHKIRWIAAAIAFVLVMACCYGGYAYINHYYHANGRAEEALESDRTVTVSYPDKNTVVFMPEEVHSGLIFYPGGKVEYTAYAPLMHELAENGVLCIVPHVTWNLAILDVNAADGYKEQFPEVEHWYLGGHSLGGSAAAMYAADHAEEYDGLILLASYSTDDLRDSGLSVLSVYGENDGVLNRDKYADYRDNLPADYTEFVIDGGCHAFFGSYGAQKGDGTPAITPEEQVATTVDYICWFINNDIFSA